MLFIKEIGTHENRISGTLKNRISGPQNIRKIKNTQKLKGKFEKEVILKKILSR
jgi:hypothetical protein